MPCIVTAMQDIHTPPEQSLESKDTDLSQGLLSHRLAPTRLIGFSGWQHGSSTPAPMHVHPLPKTAAASIIERLDICDPRNATSCMVLLHGLSSGCLVMLTVAFWIVE